jgi:glutamate decarboxylase
VPIHVDAASGGFIAPFIDPDLAWGFRLPRVASINASGHKYGLVYPGIGWVLWREPEALPEELILWVDYLGGRMPTFSLTFSRPGSQIAAQYYQFLRLGREGYRQVQQASRDTARWLSERVAELGRFELISDGGEVLAFAFHSGWIVPAYRMPPAMEDVDVLRIVVRNGFGRHMAEHLVEDLRRTVARLEASGGRPATGDRTGFHH